MLHGCAEIDAGASSKMTSWQDKFGDRRSTGDCLGSRRQLQGFGSLECKTLQDGENGQHRQQWLAPKLHFQEDGLVCAWSGWLLTAAHEGLPGLAQSRG